MLISDERVVLLGLLVQLRLLKALLGVSADLLNLGGFAFPDGCVCTQDEVACLLDLGGLLLVFENYLFALVVLDVLRILLLLLQQILILVLVLFIYLLQNLVHFDQLLVIGPCCVR